MSDFSQLANTKLGDVEKPKAKPPGHYLARFSGQMKEHKSQKKGTLAMRFPVVLIGPSDDVDAEALAAAGGIDSKEMTVDFWMTPDSMWRFTEFAKGMGAPDSLGLLEAAEWLATEGGEFLVEGTNQTSEDGKDTYFRIQNPSPAA